MAHDALDPGPDGTYPYFPRLPDGSPAWSDRCPPGYHGGRMPRGTHRQRTPSGEVVMIDMTPYDSAGNPIDPPTLQPTQ